VDSSDHYTRANAGRVSNFNGLGQIDKSPGLSKAEAISKIPDSFCGFVRLLPTGKNSGQ